MNTLSKSPSAPQQPELRQTVNLPEEFHQLARAAATAEGTSIVRFICQAIQEKAGTPDQIANRIVQSLQRK